MQLKRETIKNLFRYKIVYQVIGMYLVVLLLLSIVGYATYSTYTSWNTLRELSNEVDNYKTSVAFISSNRDLLSAKVDDYNKTLEALIPDEESYFSVVAALEKLAEKTGVTIKSYTIDLESTNMSKLSLRVEITGDDESVEKLLNDYKYTSGRLITIEKVELIRTGESVHIFLFNFYHDQYTVGSSVPQDKLTQKDVQMLEDIITQMN